MTTSQTEMSEMSDDDLRADIRAALSYRSGPDSCNTVYMGSMAVALVMSHIGERFPPHNFEKTLAKASRDSLERAYAVCANTIVFMKMHPTAACPCCGQIVPIGSIKNAPTIPSEETIATLKQALESALSAVEDLKTEILRRDGETDPRPTKPNAMRRSPRA